MIIACPKCGAKNRVDERGKAMQPVCGRCGAALPALSSAPIVVTDTSFAEVVLRSPIPVLVDCWAPWCGPCRMLTPTIDALASESAGKYLIAKLNTDENQTTAGQFKIDSIPTMLIFHHGQLVDRLVGLHPKAAIAASMAKFTPAESVASSK